VSRHLIEAEHGWHYFRQQLDAAREMLDERTHVIIHLEQQLQVLQLQVSHAPVVPAAPTAPAEPDAKSDVDEE
jgi:hypothetical protein